METSRLCWGRRIAKALAVGLLAAHLASSPAYSALPAGQNGANFGTETVSAQARSLGNWVVDSGDSQGMPFVIVDKLQSKVFVFAAQGQLRGAAPALLGLASGDDSVPGIGSRAMSTIRPHERTTPAGRFVASMARSLHGEEILWIDYDAAIALHRVITNVPKERRLQRLASGAPLDRRITYGCINVPVKFFDTVIVPLFSGTQGIVYVLPDTRASHDVFGSYDLNESKSATPTVSR